HLSRAGTPADGSTRRSGCSSPRHIGLIVAKGYNKYMVRRGVLGIVVLAANLRGMPLVQVDITPVNYPTPMPAGASVSGVVTNIDPVNRMIQIRDASGMIQTIRVDDRIQILRNGSPANFSTVS